MDILTVDEGAEGPTQIMYKANLSWSLLRQHLKELVELGILLEHSIKNRFTYQLAEKGISILRSYRLVVQEVHVADHNRSQLNTDRQQDNFGVRQAGFEPRQCYFLQLRVR